MRKEMKNYLEAVEGKTMLSFEEAYKQVEVGGFTNLIGWGPSAPTDIVVCPTYMTPRAVGADCFASEDITIRPGEVKTVPIGIKAKFDGDELGLFPFIRSSIPKKMGLLLANGVGVIEEDYHGNPDNDGNIGFMFVNISMHPVTIKRFERIGQLVLLPIERFENAGQAGMQRGESGSTGN